MNNNRNRKKHIRGRRHRKPRFLFLILLPAIVICMLLTAKLFYLPLPLSSSGTGVPDSSTASGLDNRDETSWSLILVNKWNFIPENYEVELTTLENGEAIDKRIYPALQSMFDDARDNGIYPVAASGYRTAEEQQELMDEKIAEYKSEGYNTDEATAKACAWVAIPGTSEHQLGLSVDINADKIHSTGSQVYDWLEKNSYKYGFIRRYPPDKTDITGVINEPWHYRYVGVSAAYEIHKQNICLEEFLEK